MKKRVYFTMVFHPIQERWLRVGNAYPSRSAAQEWIPVVRGAWHGCKARVSQLTITVKNGEIDERSKRILDEKYNMDSPAPSGGKGARE